MRVCSHCKIKKAEDQFNFKNKRLGTLQKACKECTRKQIQVHYYNNKQYYLDKARRRNKIIRDEIKHYIWEYLKAHSCIDCGEADPLVLEFDHIKAKAFTIASLARDHTLKTVKEEIEKCVVRCANCHRRKTAKQFGWHKQFMPL